MRTKSVILDSISTLLASAGRATANAVTGQIHPDCINLLCAYSEESASDKAETVISKVVIDPVEGGNLLQTWWDIPDLPEVDCFSTHASQIGSILAYVWSRGEYHLDDHAIRDVYFAFSCFIARRARSTIVGRINYVKNIWDDCPFKTMRTWYEANKETVPFSIVKFPYVQRTLADLLADHDLQAVADPQPEADQSIKYNLSPSNMLNWIHVLEKTVNDILQAFGDTKVAPSREQTLRAHTAIENLHTLLRSNLSDVLSEHGVISFHWQDCETAVQHLFRCLETIPVWHRAIITILPSKAMPLTLCLFTLRHASSVDIGVKDARDFFRQYEPGLLARVSAADAWQLEAVQNRLNAVKKRVHLRVEHEDQGEVASGQVRRFSTVHPEAALMALAWAHSRGAAQSVSLESDVELDAVLPTEGTNQVADSEPTSINCPWFSVARIISFSLGFPRQKFLRAPTRSRESFLRPSKTLAAFMREQDLGNNVSEQAEKYSKAI
ncbi:hypothetical protein ACG7TL_001910 [Trametes sanguinea]